MSWYSSANLTCHKCGERCSSAIECLSHTRVCQWRTNRYPNGSFEREDLGLHGCGARIICAPNAFGGQWKVKVAVGTRAEPIRIKRQGKFWEPAFVDCVGFTWTAVPKDAP